ncbi:MAG: hypothetical protein BWY80_00171 [Firmicutes bacterium ADurb.Bin456]|nr:MAG: hypothetical protein BWY80_00171 [Firmicutes bacterium ADurb.Bin456]
MARTYGSVRGIRLQKNTAALPYSIIMLKVEINLNLIFPGSPGLSFSPQELSWKIHLAGFANPYVHGI